MKRLLIISITVAMILPSCNSNTRRLKEAQKIPSKQILEIEKAKSDPIRTLAGFYLGMTESDIFEYIKKNHSIFFINSSQQLKFLHTKIDDIDYSIDFTLYKGKLFNVMIMCNKCWPQVDDGGLKENFHRVFNLVKGLYKNRHISNPYYDKFKVDWPYSLGSNNCLTMAKIQDPDLDVLLEICNDLRGGYSFDIIFRYNDYSMHESTLENVLYFDNF